MEHYVTLFDILFLPQGLSLHMSMERHAGPYTLWVLCLDDEVHEVLTRFKLPNVRLLQLSKLEPPELLAVKPTRSRREYCWTLTPFAPRFVFEADPRVSRVTYLDADMWFRKSPAPIFRELEVSAKAVLITDHAYAPEHDHSVKYGQYCVQFMTFVRDSGEIVRKWWEDRCVEWCFIQPEEGRFGDQKYLDDWPIRYPELVHVLTNKELALAPWNATRFPYGNSVTWHFHSLRILTISRKSCWADYGPYLLPKCTREYVYKPYIKDLRGAIRRMQSNGVILRPQGPFSLFGCMRDRLRFFSKHLWLFNIRLVARL